MRRSPTWPVLKTYDAANLRRVAMPIGGIGTGTVSLGGRGDLRDWELMNRPAKGFTPRVNNLDVGPFFAVWAQARGGDPVARIAEGPIDAEDYDGFRGCGVTNHGLPRFTRARFATAYPFAQVLLDDPAVPLGLRLEAFNPFIPGDVARSSLPVAILRFVLTNTGDQPVSAAVCGTLPNYIGQDGANARPDWLGNPDLQSGCRHNRNHFREQDGLHGFYMDSAGVAPDAPQWGSLALTTTAYRGITQRSRWMADWGVGSLDFWDEFAADGRVSEPQTRDQHSPTASLCVRLTVPPNDERTVTFILAWHFPNRPTWTPPNLDETAEETQEFPRPDAPDDSADCGCGPTGCGRDPNVVGNHYCTVFADAWEAAAYVAAELRSLEADSLRFTQTVCRSDLPASVKEAALFNLSTLRTQTCFRTADGIFAGWEGCGDHAGCCHGSCSHVWNYELASSYLFADLARSMRRHQFLHGTNPDGLMSFRLNLPVATSCNFGYAAADGQLGAIMRLYLDWQLSGDDSFLRQLWPAARRALQFCWIPRGWDHDQDGVMEGCQHNTMDVEYFGPNPQMQSWYLGALRAMEEMAEHLGDAQMAELAVELFISGSRWTDGFLYNGDYYEQQIIAPMALDRIAPGLQLKNYHDMDLSNPDWQLGEGCLIDQLVGQHTAHLLGLGYLLEPEHVGTTVAAIERRNRKADFSKHFGCTRSYVMPGESGVLMATYPDGYRPQKPFPYFTEVMTGFEYVLAVGLVQEGLEAEALRIVGDVRARYDGRKRNPYDEAECGHHYVRAMASWSLVPALTGFRYSAVTGALRFADRPGRFPWASGDAWGEVIIRKTSSGRSLRLAIHGGSLRLRDIGIDGRQPRLVPHPGPYAAGDTVILKFGT